MDVGVAVGGGGGGGGVVGAGGSVFLARDRIRHGGTVQRSLRAALALLGGKVQSCDLSCGLLFNPRAVLACAVFSFLFFFLFFFFCCPDVWAFTSPPHEAHFQLIHPPTVGRLSGRSSSQGDGMLVVFFIVYPSCVSLWQWRHHVYVYK